MYEPHNIVFICLQLLDSVLHTVPTANVDDTEYRTSKILIFRAGLCVSSSIMRVQVAKCLFKD